MPEEKDLTKSMLEMYSLLHRYHMMWYGQKFGGLDPWQGQGKILSALKNKQAISQKELGFALDIRAQSLGELLHKLEANGYIKRYRSKTDKRALVVKLTEKGETFQDQKPDYEEIFIGLSKTERKDLQESLDKISEELREWRITELEKLEYFEGLNYPTSRI